MAVDPLRTKSKTMTAHQALEEVFDLIKAQRYESALQLLLIRVRQAPTDWNAWYLAGQCYRFMGDLDNALRHLSRAADLNADSAPVFLALGITLQLMGHWTDSAQAFHQAIRIDGDYALAYNSLALTQRHSGDLERALHNYDEAARALARQIASGLHNRRDNTILKHDDTRGSIWLEYAMWAAVHLTAIANVSTIAWPTGRAAQREECTEEHQGLLWVDRFIQVPG
jgi:tetratricopeptide (TPR) repeat protein